MNQALLFGVLGHPALHSLSPAMYEAAFKFYKLPHRYEIFDVAPEDLKSFFDRVRSGEISGFNVTIPYKQSLFSFLDDVSEEALRLNAVNTIYRDANQKLIGTNTDCLGFQKSLLDSLGVFPEKSYAVVLGAGGAAAAVAFALAALRPESLVIVNRTREKAEALVARIQIYFPDLFVTATGWEKASLVLDEAGLVVNTTSLGLELSWPSLEFLKWLPAAATVVDIVYRPRLTPFLIAAQKWGHRIVTGDGMLLFQAQIAFELFIGQKAPAKIMADALARNLK